jgi:hypothetical protein
MESDHVSPESDPVDDVVVGAESEPPAAPAAGVDDAPSAPSDTVVDAEAAAQVDAESETEVDTELVADADADAEPAPVDEPEAEGDNNAPAESATAADEDDVDGPSVDELEGRLGEVEQAMTQIQSGQLDEAEATLASLDQRIGSTSD